VTADRAAELVGYAVALAVALVPSLRIAVRAEARRGAAELLASLPCQGGAPALPQPSGASEVSCSHR
jgi:hypothetical protein